MKFLLYGNVVGCYDIVSCLHAGSGLVCHGRSYSDFWRNGIHAGKYVCDTDLYCTVCIECQSGFYFLKSMTWLFGGPNELSQKSPQPSDGPISPRSCPGLMLLSVATIFHVSLLASILL